MTGPARKVVSSAPGDHDRVLTERDPAWIYSGSGLDLRLVEQPFYWPPARPHPNRSHGHYYDGVPPRLDRKYNKALYIIVPETQSVVPEQYVPTNENAPQLFFNPSVEF